MTDTQNPEPDTTDPEFTGNIYAPSPPPERKTQDYPELNRQGVWEGTTPKEPVE